MENNLQNITSVSVGTLVTELTNYYLGGMKVMTLKELPSIFLWGPYGVGKSDAVKQIGARLEKETGKKVVVTDIRLLLYSPVDLKGVPMADEKREFTNWLTPKVFQMDVSPDTLNILFLDELSAAPPMVQAAAYQIVLDRMVGDYALPENCIVIAAGNRTTDRSVAYRMPNALANRFIHFSVEADYSSYLSWAATHGIHERVLGYMAYCQANQKTTLFGDEIELDDVAFATPRSWSFVSKILDGQPGVDVKNLHGLISGAIGVGNAIEFEGWCEIYEQLPDIDSIFLGTCKEYPNRQDVLYALTASLISKIIKNKNHIYVMELENVCAYVSKFPADFLAFFYRSLLEDETVKLKLMTGNHFKKWIETNHMDIV